jgi:outer membrane immunogenic protein
MKKKIFIMTIIVALMFIVQSCAKKEFDVMTGVQKSSIVGESDSWKDPIGFQAGANMPLVKFSEAMSGIAEVNLSMQGAKWEENIGGETFKGRVNLLYANIPLVVRYQTQSGFFGEAGIQPGFLLSAKDKYSGNSDNYKPYVNTFDFSIPFGVGYELKNGFGIGLRVIPGLTNINKEDDAKDRNFVVALRGTYTFKLK